MKRYLSDDTLQEKISGYIDLCGMGHDVKKQYSMIQEKILEETTDPEIAHWIDTQPEPTLDNYLVIENYIAEEMTPDFIWDAWDEQMSETALHYGACSPVDIMSWSINNGEKMRHSKKWTQMNEAMFEHVVDVSGIHIPTLVLTGRYDYDCNDKVAVDFFESIATKSDQKEHVFFEKSGHTPDITEPDRFAEVISQFVDRYR